MGKLFKLSPPALEFLLQAKAFGNLLQADQGVFLAIRHDAGGTNAKVEIHPLAINAECQFGLYLLEWIPCLHHRGDRLPERALRAKRTFTAAPG